MANLRSKSVNQGLTFTLKSPSETVIEDFVNDQKPWEYTTTGRANEVLNLGGGNVYETYSDFHHGSGSYVFTPKENFIGAVNIWGAGGGAEHDSGDRWAGGGGYAEAFIDFVKDVPYTIVVGQGGKTENARTHGGGGRGHNNQGGSGGGLSGIFMNVEHTGNAAWGQNAAPLSRSDALIIAGGGGGGGHHNGTTNHGQAGAGGGWLGKRAHNAQPGTQNAGGAGGYSGVAGGELSGGNSATNSNWLGGGGGGWYGGGGGGHSGSHHNGGAGGSGHHAYTSAVATQPNNDLAKYIFNGYMERGAGSYHFISGLPGNWRHPLATGGDGGFAGQGGWGAEHNGTINRPKATQNTRHGKVVITKMPDFIGNYRFPPHNDVYSNSWTQTY